MIKKAISVLSSAVLTAAAFSAPLMPVMSDGQLSQGIIAAMAADSATACNPVIWSDVPDCDVIRVGDTYYMVSTTMFFSPGAPIMKSNDLVSWEICNYVYDTLADGDVQNLTNGKHDYAHGQWAASLRYHKGRFYVFFGSYGTGKSYIYSTDDIENGTWTRSEVNGMYHDASILFDDDGRNYLVYGGGGEIKIKEFNSEMTGFKQGGLDKTLFKTGLDGLAGEGSHVQKIGDYYYVFVIAWPSGSGRIELCYRSKSLTGNFEGKTVLNSGLGTYGSGVAQGGIVDTPDGQWYGMLFQDHGCVGRIPVLVPVTWQNDWPMMGVNGKAPVTIEVEGGFTGTHLVANDDFDYSSNDLDLQWQWNHNPDNKSWSVTQRPGWLRLTNNNTASHILNARNTLTTRTEGPNCSGVVKLDTKGMKAGDYAGLSAFQFKYGNVGVHVNNDGSKKIYMSENGGYSGNAAVTDSKDKIVEEVNMTGDEVYLKVNFNFNTVDGNFNVSNNIDKADFYYSYDGSSWTKIGNTLSMSYDLKLFTGYRFGLYSYGTSNKGGYADFDFFNYDRAEWNAPTIVEPDPDGYFFHHRFEGKTEGWSGRGSASVSTSGRFAYADKEALLIQDREAEWNGAIYTLGRNFKAGEEYSFSVNATYADGDDTREFKLTLEYTDADGETTWDKIATGKTSAGQWVQLSNTNYMIPAGASNCKLIVETIDGSLENFYIDEAIGAPAGTVIDGAGQPAVREYLIGDTDFDGRISALDIITERKAVLGKITDTLTLKNADVDKDGEVNVNDLVLLQKFIMGQISEFPDNTPAPVEPEKTPYTYNPAVTYKEAPASYFSKDGCKGKLINETYTGINGQKKLNVYLPPDYDESKKYNVFYLMHGGGENEDVLINDSDKFYINYLVDHMIQNGEVEPMIMVFPTFNGCPDGAGDVWDEMKQSIVPFVEGKYSTYAENTTPAGLEASRMHRAYGGFSMGGGSTWNVLINDNDYFAYYMPLSGHCWGGATPILNVMKNHKYKDQTYIFAATGTEDIAYNNMVGLINDLKKDSSIKYTSDFSKGNFYFLEAAGKTHWWGYVKHYVYDGLPCFFRE